MMTEAQMTEALRRRGYTVRLPPDMREAGPWKRSSSGAWERCWVGSSSACAAALVQDRETANVFLGYWHASHHKKRYFWSVRLMGKQCSKYSFSTRGASDNIIDAKREADRALLRALREARDARLKRDFPCQPDLNEPLSLDGCDK